MKEFLTYDMLTVYATFILILYAVVEFVKESEPFKSMKTKYVAFWVGCALMTIVYVYLYVVGFVWDGNIGKAIIQFILYIAVKIPLIALNAIMFTFASNGMSDFNNKVDKTRKDS